MKKIIKIIAIIVVIIVAITSIGLYWINKPKLIGEFHSEDDKYIVSFIETKEPILFFDPSEVKIELRSNDEKITEKQEISTSIANDGKRLDDNNWKINFKDDHVEIILIGEEQEDEVIKIYYIRKKSQ